jgi:YgiT-type zinc finger domain-containing protein
METRVTDLPFKTGDRSIVILKALPVLQCRQCADIELEHEVMERVEAVLASANRVAELEIVPYAA